MSYEVRLDKDAPYCEIILYCTDYFDDAYDWREKHKDEYKERLYIEEFYDE